MLGFAFLLVEKNVDWYRRLLATALGRPASALAAVNPRQVVGTVLCVNGFRQYFQIYHAKHKPRYGKCILLPLILYIHCPSESVDALVTFVMQLCKLREDFDDDGQLASIAPKLHGKGDEGVHTLDGTEYAHHPK